MLMPVIAEISNEMLETVMRNPEMDNVMLQATASALAISSSPGLAEMKTQRLKQVIVQSTDVKKRHHPVMRHQRVVEVHTTKNRSMAMHVVQPLRHAAAAGLKCLRYSAAKSPALSSSRDCIG